MKQYENLRLAAAQVLCYAMPELQAGPQGLEFACSMTSVICGARSADMLICEYKLGQDFYFQIELAQQLTCGESTTASATGYIEQCVSCLSECTSSRNGALSSF